MLAAKAAVAPADTAIAQAQKVVDRLRQEHGQTIAAAVSRYHDAAATAINFGAQILAATEGMAATEHAKLPVLAFPLKNRGPIAAMLSRAVWQENDRAQRAFSTAAAAISAQSRPLPAAAPISWRGSLAELVGGVVEGPVRVRPGSKDTSERIPASAFRKS